LDYANYFLAYTATVIVCRFLFAEFIGGRSPYGTITLLLAVMLTSVLCFIFFTDSSLLYVLGAVLFGIGYGVSYPIVKAMAANDSEPELMSKTMQIFGFSYFIGVFGFPFIAGWIITTKGMILLLVAAAGMSALECILAARRYFRDRWLDSMKQSGK
jgi:MFS family permease